MFDAQGELPPASDAISGFPGAAGIVEGRARVIGTADEGDQLQAGEILVTTVTNVGWTPLFPRAAAIVARELGIPAGDGGLGTVEVL